MDEKDIISQLVAEAVQDGRKMATIREVSQIDDIPGADRIKVATIEGWKVVVLAHEFKEGDLCVFFEVDSFLPMADERYKFLEQRASTWRGVRGARLKTMKMRGQISQGLALPISLFEEELKGITENDRKVLREMNLTGVLNIMKWEKILTEDQAANTAGNFPPFIQKSDQERCQNMGDVIFGTGSFVKDGKRLRLTPVPLDVVEGGIAALISADRVMKVGDNYHAILGDEEGEARYEVSLKLDGSSMTVFSQAETFDAIRVGVCSRNYELKTDDPEANFVKTAMPILEFFKANPEFANYALQGELMGPGIQGNRENLPDKKFYVYNVYSIVAGEYLTPQERQDFLKRINDVAGHELVRSVPIVDWNVTLKELGITDMDSLLKYAEGPSLHHKVREGLVFKEVSGRHQFKAIANNFLLKEE